MSGKNDKADDNALTEDVGGPVAGERLAQARREQQIPLLEIAKELHLDEYKVRALERNEFDVIGAPVFAKGHLRKFAQLVHVSEADVMADYYELTRASAAQPFISVRPKPRKAISPGPWLAVIAVLLLIAMAYWWFAVREPALDQPVSGAVVPLPQTTDLPVEDDIDSDAQQSPVELPVELPDEQQEIDEIEALVVEVETPAQPERSDAASMNLRITYSGDCWTEITDAMGRRLFFDLGKAGRTVNLSGDAPFNVLFGNAENVSLIVNGADFDIPAANRRGRTARLTINGT